MTASNSMNHRTEDLAPIALFVYNRPEHTKQTVDALLNNPLAQHSDLFIFSDAARSAQAADKVKRVREYIATVSGFKSIRITEREHNWGLASSIIDGVTQLCQRYGRVIVLEDDLVVAPGFLAFMNAGLSRYEAHRQVMQVSGFMFPVPQKTGDALFLPMTTSWGWATWERAWKHFDAEAKAFDSLSASKTLRKRFDLGGAYPYYQMLESQLAGKIDSWAIRWYLSVFMKDGRVLYPPYTLVMNAGMDGSGTHCQQSDAMQAIEFLNSPIGFPQEIALSGQLEAIAISLAVNPLHKFFSKVTRFLKWPFVK